VTFLLVILLTLPQQASDRVLSGTVEKVSDGDTLTVLTSNRTKIKVRLHGIDAPEAPHGRLPGQPFGEASQRVLERKVLRQEVTLEIVGVDRYRRLICLVRLGSRSMNEAMIQEGWAWAYRKYLKGPEALDFLALEQDARRRRAGLWQDSNPQPPWEFRKAIRTN
jgi:endonuclease YncB( thermonuclease family)